jgi:hypothetical protein
MNDARKAVCIIAWPAGHSRSPLIHNYWIKHHGLNAEYRREPVPPEKFVDFVKNLRAHGYVGANVTLPHKQVALTVTEPDERARAVGAEVEAISSCERMLKSLSWPGGMRCRCRRRPSISVSAWATASADRAETSTWPIRGWPMSCFITVV